LKVRLPVVGNDDWLNWLPCLTRWQLTLRELTNRSDSLNKCDVTLSLGFTRLTNTVVGYSCNERGDDRRVVNDPETVKRYQQNMENEITHMGQSD